MDVQGGFDLDPQLDQYKPTKPCQLAYLTGIKVL